MSSTASDLDVVEYCHYHPRGVHNILASGTSAFIGEVDESTVLKYPLEQGGDLSRLEHEYKLLKIIGPNKRIIAIAKQGFTDDGLYLQRAPNGTLLTFVSDTRHCAFSLSQRMTWCREVVEAVAHVHSKNVIHCDINPANILLDDELHIRLSDFQGCLLDNRGEVLLPSLVGEPCRYYCPRDGNSMATWKTDIFALGSTIHFIMTREEIFSDITAGEQDWDERVRSRFLGGAFPDSLHPCSSITRKCWTQQYTSAKEILEDIEKVEQLIGIDTSN